MKRFIKDKKNIVILLLGALSLIMVPQEGLRFFLWVLTGVVLCGLLDYFFNRLFLKKTLIPKSAVITGFIVSGILDYHQSWFILVIFSCLAIFSKHVLRFKKRHIFNPANFALFFATLFRIPLTWHIESNIFIIVGAGTYFAYTFKKLPQVLGFLIFFLSLFSLTGVNPFLMISFFFLFVMLIEPKTSGYGVRRGFIFGSIAGMASYLVFRFSTIDFFVSALFIANACKPLLEKIKEKKYAG